MRLKSNPLFCVLHFFSLRIRFSFFRKIALRTVVSCTHVPPIDVESYARKKDSRLRNIKMQPNEKLGKKRSQRRKKAHVLAIKYMQTFTHTHTLAAHHYEHSAVRMQTEITASYISPALIRLFYCWCQREKSNQTLRSRWITKKMCNFIAVQFELRAASAHSFYVENEIGYCILLGILYGKNAKQKSEA